MKKEGRINVRYRVEMNILRAPSRLKAVWVTVITQTRMNGSKLINWIFNGVQQQFGLNEHFPMVPNSSLGMNLGSICTIQVLSIVRTGMYGVCLVWWRDRHLKPRVFKLEPLENILAIHKIIGNERKVKTIMLEHVLIWLPESILKFSDCAGSWLTPEYDSKSLITALLTSARIPWFLTVDALARQLGRFEYCHMEPVVRTTQHSVLQTKKHLGTYPILQIPSTSEDHPGTAQQPLNDRSR